MNTNLGDQPLNQPLRVPSCSLNYLATPLSLGPYGSTNPLSGRVVPFAAGTEEWDNDNMHDTSGAMAPGETDQPINSRIVFRTPGLYLVTAYVYGDDYPSGSAAGVDSCSASITLARDPEGDGMAQTLGGPSDIMRGKYPPAGAGGGQAVNMATLHNAQANDFAYMNVQNWSFNYSKAIYAIRFQAAMIGRV